MRIGILSDSHDQVSRTRTAVSDLVRAGAAALFHCGDLTNPEVAYELQPLPNYVVFGNCDHDLDELRQSISIANGTCLEQGGWVVLAGKRIAITHGDSQAELERLLTQSPDYLFSGHTHRITDFRRDGTRFINPGALHRAPQWTVAVLDLESDELNLLTIKDL
jgi:putative phosphoesterase